MSKVTSISLSTNCLMCIASEDITVINAELEKIHMWCSANRLTLNVASLIWPRQSLGSSCQSAEMASLLNSVSFVLTVSFLPTSRYRVIMIIHVL